VTTKYFFKKDDQCVLNRCTKFLSRYNTDARHSYGAPGEQSQRDRIAEAWRFPVIDTYGGGADAVNDPAQFDDYNEVTFIYAGADGRSPASVSVIGTFATLYEPIPLEPAIFEDEPTRFWSLTYVVPKDDPRAEVHILDAGHFALDLKPNEIIRLTQDFMAKRTANSQ